MTTPLMDDDVLKIEYFKWRESMCHAPENANQQAYWLAFKAGSQALRTRMLPEWLPIDTAPKDMKDDMLLFIYRTSIEAKNTIQEQAEALKIAWGALRLIEDMNDMDTRCSQPACDMQTIAAMKGGK